MIRQRLPLAAGSARCPETRTKPCARAHECARGTEPHAIGRPANDYSAEPRVMGRCGWFVAIQYAAPGQTAPTVHDAPGWLR